MKTLVIGYGNTLRGDDGVGYRLAEMLETLALEGVEAYPCHQLTPELAADLARVDRVIFVDATPPQNPPSPLRLERLSGGSSPNLGMHHAHPGQILALAENLYGHSPLAYALLLPSSHMGYGETLSPIAQVGLEQGLGLLQTLLLQPSASLLPD
ncbi:MAG: hydrogenase maturation protease [Nodosilinea sp.]